jgi:hypothetical protein
MEAGASHFRWTVLIATLAWTGLGLQFYITPGQSMATGKTLGSAITSYLSFFTILTNLLAASATTFSSLGSSRLERFFSQPAVLTAIAIYILVVGVVYSLVLRELWAPTGSQKVADLLPHELVPRLRCILDLLRAQKWPSLAARILVSVLSAHISDLHVDPGIL